jgi:hypothetical protein
MPTFQKRRIPILVKLVLLRFFLLLVALTLVRWVRGLWSLLAERTDETTRIMGLRGHLRRIGAHHRDSFVGFGWLLLLGDFVGIERQRRMDAVGGRNVFVPCGHAHGFLFFLDEVEGVFEGF